MYTVCFLSERESPVVGDTFKPLTREAGPWNGSLDRQFWTL